MQPIHLAVSAEFTSVLMVCNIFWNTIVVFSMFLQIIYLLRLRSYRVETFTSAFAELKISILLIGRSFFDPPLLHVIFLSFVVPFYFMQRQSRIIACISDPKRDQNVKDGYYYVVEISKVCWENMLSNICL